MTTKKMDIRVGKIINGRKILSIDYKRGRYYYGKIKCLTCGSEKFYNLSGLRCNGGCFECAKRISPYRNTNGSISR